MNKSTEKALDRIEQSLDRSARKRRLGFSTSPFVLAIALALGYQLLTRIVPQLWATVLPGGFAQGAFLPGLAHLVWRLAWFCHTQFLTACIICGTIFAVAFWLGRRPLTRPLAWLMAVLAIAADAAILMIALQTGMQAAGADQMLG